MSSQSDKRLVTIDRDEWWPVYSIGAADARYGEPRAVPVALIDRAAKALAEFDAVQTELRMLWDNEEDDQ